MPYWLGFAGEAAPVHKGCKQGAPESPQVWNIEVIGPGPVIRKGQQEKKGVLPPDSHSRRWGSRAMGVGRCRTVV